LRITVGRTFADGGVLVLAAAVAAGAWLAGSGPSVADVAVPVWSAAVAVVVAFAARRPVLVLLALPVLAFALGQQALAGAAPASPALYRGVVTLVSDPADGFGAVRADVRADGHRYELSLRGAGARVVRPMLAGERLRIDAEVTPRPDDAPWLLTRHVVGRMTTDAVEVVDDGDPASRAANGFRRILERGAAVMGPDDRSLFAGFVLGDDRGESDATIDDFRAAGLSHLLAVSGENVAFVLAVARPLVGRLGLRSRFVATAGVLAFFALVTRFEPSVLRAVAMMLIATWGVTIGREISGIRVLGLAVVALVLLDPFLVRSVGFQLSVGASLGILLLARPIGARLPGPRLVAELVAVTIAAQIGVAPVLLPVFGGVPVAALPANLLAVPAAGPIMIWGLSGGVVAGLGPATVAAALHAPTRLLLWWERHIASGAAALPLGQVTVVHAAVASAGVAIVVLARRAGARGATWTRTAQLLGGALVVGALVVAACTVGQPASSRTELTRGATLWWAPGGGGAVLVVDGRARLGDVLDGLRASGIRQVDVVVERSRSSGSDPDVTVLVDRLAPGLVLAPPGSALVGATEAKPGQRYELPAIAVTVRSIDPTLVVDVVVRSGDGVGSARGPPLTLVVLAHRGRVAVERQ
jgi:competence protein ComEC